MEYTDYYVAKGNAATLRLTLEECADKALVADSPDAGFSPFVAVGTPDDFESRFDWLLSVFDAEGGAWGFQLYIDGAEIASATYGENAEWGIDLSDNGFTGDMDATAGALGTTTAALEACLNADGVEAFCRAVGFEHQYMLYPHENEMPDGVVMLSDLA